VCRYTREAEAAAAAEDERRKAAVKASSKVLAASLAEQLVLKETLKHAHDGEEQVRLQRVHVQRNCSKVSTPPTAGHDSHQIYCSANHDLKLLCLVLAWHVTAMHANICLPCRIL
jgi:hypothetical protein